MQLDVGKIVEGKVTGITNFGAFIDLGEGKTGMVHISEVSAGYVKEIADHLKEGEQVKVKVLKVGDDGKISLSIKQAQPQAPRPDGANQNNRPPRRPQQQRGPRGNSGGCHLRICSASLSKTAKRKCLTSNATSTANAAPIREGAAAPNKNRPCPGVSWAGPF